ncbi:MAG: ATP-binding protein, partial [Treponema sp.]|nr:ATP-binding protein [Treponema sp.]
KPFIKIITGLRRSGKSTILRLLKEELSVRADEEHIVYLNLEDFEFTAGFDAAQLNALVMERITDKKTHYILLDEIQIVPGWERVVNSLFASKPVDIYITGSNSRLLSSELATLLAGRYVEILVRTLSFAEYLDFKKETTGEAPKNIHGAVWEYIERGGFPAVHIANIDRETARRVVKDIYASVLLRDTIQRYKIRNIDFLERLLRFLFDNTGNLFSAKSITDYIKNLKHTIDVETIYNYINALESAFIIKKAPRYDIKGKEFLNFREKYYPGDISLTYAALGFDLKRISGILETIIFTELERRGFSVYVGKLNEQEVDFVGLRGTEKIYVQAAYLLGDNRETIEREFGPLKRIDDNFPKYVVTLDERWSDSIDGIRWLHLADFLLGDGNREHY